MTNQPPIEARDAAEDRAALWAAGVAVARYCPVARSLAFSPEAAALTGLSPGQPISEMVRAVERRHRRAVVEFFDALDGRGRSITAPLRTASGERRFVRLTVAAAPADGRAATIVISDVTAEQESIERLSVEAAHLRATVEFNPQMPWQADGAGNIIAFTERYEVLTGRSQEELVGFGWELITHPDDLPGAMAKVQHSIMTGTAIDTRVRVRMADGAYRWFRATGYPQRDAEGRVIRWYGYSEDIDDHVLMEQQIRWTAEHDALTRLPNRMVFNQQLDEAVRTETRLGSKVGILLADVDNFKDVNDVLGHDAGDALLVAFADVLRRSLPDKAMLSRIGGDEFAIVLPFDGPIEELRQVAGQVFAGLREPVSINGQTIECRVSIGASVFPFHGQSPTELFKNADIALYQAKARGRGQLTIFALEMKQETQRRVAMINLGRRAVETDSIVPYYQVQVALDGERPIGFEALLRRRDRQGRICAPSSIAAAFEDASVAEALGDAMLKAVLADMRRAKSEGIELGTVSVNFSTAEFRSPSFVDRLTDRLSEAEIEFSSLMIEVTEGVFLGRAVDTVAQTIRTLDELGFRIALDDFGTGYASLVHLRQLPVDTLKIDQSFVRSLGESRDDLAIVTAIINLGASLGLKIIAEGIETDAQLAILKGLKLRYGQGYRFGHPAPIEEACALLAPSRAPEFRRFA